MSTDLRNDPAPLVTDENRAEWKARFNEGDRAAGTETAVDFEPFSQRDDIFNRAFWDPTITSRATEQFFASYRIGSQPPRSEGFTQKDFALRNASWVISDLISSRTSGDGTREGFIGTIRPDTPKALTSVEYENPSDASAELKSVACLFGADLCGITEFDERWVYRSTVDA